MTDTNVYRKYNSNIQAPNMKCGILRADDVLGATFDIVDMEERLAIAEYDIDTIEADIPVLDSRIGAVENHFQTVAGKVNLNISGDSIIGTGSAYKINGVTKLTETSLDSSVTSSGLTSIGTQTGGVNIATGQAYKINGVNKLTETALDATVTSSGLTSIGTQTGGVNIATGQAYKINGVNKLTDTALGGTVTGSSLTSVGTLTSLTVSGSTSSDEYITTHAKTSISASAIGYTKSAASVVVGLLTNNSIVRVTLALDLTAGVWLLNLYVGLKPNTSGGSTNVWETSIGIAEWNNQTLTFSTNNTGFKYVNYNLMNRLVDDTTQNGVYYRRPVLHMSQVYATDSSITLVGVGQFTVAGDTTTDGTHTCITAVRIA